MESIDLLTPYYENRAKEFKKFPTAWDKDGNLIEDRNQYLQSLQKDEDGLPIINQEEFDALAYEFGWETEFIQSYLVDNGMISAWDYDEFHHITE